jgi:hypothetical protein
MPYRLEGTPALSNERLYQLYEVLYANLRKKSRPVNLLSKSVGEQAG